jgi:orotate phosphoribosyltransferase
MSSLWESISTKITDSFAEAPATKDIQAVQNWIDAIPTANSDRRPLDVIAQGMIERLVETPAPDAGLVVCDLLPKEIADTIHRTALLDCMTLSPIKRISLLHHTENTTHYFDCDAFLARDSDARTLVAATLLLLTATLEPDALACSIAPNGLIGTYPLCFHVGLTLGIDVVPILLQGREPTSVAGSRDKGTYIIVNDVLTTGTSVVQIDERLRASESTVSGAIVLYDRQQGGAEQLHEQGIPQVAVMSRRSLRSYCLGVTSDPGAPNHLREKAAMFLRVTSGLIVKALTANSRLGERSSVTVASGAAPPLTAFDSDLRFRPEAVNVQAERVRTEIEAAHKDGDSAIVFPELTIPLAMREELQSLSRETGLLIVGGAEYDELHRNIGFIAVDGDLIEQPKLVRSKYDLESLVVGDVLHVLSGTPLGDIGMLVCADQGSYRLMEALRDRVQVVVVVARNRAVETFASMSAGDSYRLNSYMLYANAASSGRSFLASPEKGPAKIQWFDSAETRWRVELDIRGLMVGSNRFHDQLEY